MKDTAEWLTRLETKDDVEAVRAVTLAAFETAAEADLLDELRSDPAWIDGLSIVATTNQGQVVGHAVLTRGHVDDVPVLALGPVSVLPQYQRSGVGTCVVRAALEAASAMGEVHVVLLGHPTYYPRFGFRRASEVGIALRTEVRDETFMAVTLNPERPLPSGTFSYAASFGPEWS